MTYSRKRPTGGYGVSIFETPSKAVFDAVVEERGFAPATVVRTNVGEWNEARQFYVNGQKVEVAMKGSKPNWAAMIADVQKMEAAR